MVVAWAASTLAPGLGPAANHDPFAMFADWDSGNLAVLAALVLVAVAVSAYGARRARREHTSSALRPQGRVLADHGVRHFGTAWRQQVARLEASEATTIAQAGRGPVRLLATIVRTTGSLGGDPSRACVWRNRAGGRPDSAVASELIVIADDSGRCGVENLERARVTASTEKVGVHYEWTSLYVGDRVELLGRFDPDPTGENTDDARDVVYGTLGGTGPLQLRLVDRPAAAATPLDAQPEPQSES